MASFPQQWWKNRPLIIAHRGASLLAPENTMSAFRKAIQIGADGIELDVRLTIDGIPIVLHDSQVDKTTNGHGAVDDLTLREVQELDAGSWFSDSFDKETIPTLEEVLDELGGKTIINIELKTLRTRDCHLAESVCALVKKMELEESVWFSSFRPSLLRQTRKNLPKVPNGYLYSTRSPAQSLMQITTPIEAVHPYYRTVDKKYVARLHNMEKRVAVWTVDDSDAAQRCFDANVDVIISNDPNKMIQTLR